MTWNRRHRNLLPVTGQTTSYAAGDDGHVQAGFKPPSRMRDDGTVVTDLASALAVHADAPPLRWIENPVATLGSPFTSLLSWYDALVHVTGMSNIDGVTQANPGVVTTAQDHHLSNGDSVTIWGVEGMTELNGNTYTVANKTADTFALSGTDTSGFTAYSSGGIVGGPNGVTHDGVGPWRPSDSPSPNPGGWRLPNILELISEMDFEAGSHHGVDAAFDAQYAWTATTNQSDTTEAFILRPSIGFFRPYPKTNAYYTLMVRGGRVNV